MSVPCPLCRRGVSGSGLLGVQAHDPARHRCPKQDGGGCDGGVGAVLQFGQWQQGNGFAPRDRASWPPSTALRGVCRLEPGAGRSRYLTRDLAFLTAAAVVGVGRHSEVSWPSDMRS